MDDMSSLFIQILNMGISGAYVIVAVLMLRLLMRRLPKKYSYCLWGIAALRLLFPFTLSSSFSLFNLKPFRRIASEMGRGIAYISQEIGYQAQPEIDTGISMVNEAVNRVLPEATPASSMNPMQGYLYIGARIWIAGIAVLLIYMLASWVGLQKRIRSAVLLKEENGILGKVTEGKKKRLHVYECENISVPFAIGIFRARIYLPIHLKEEERLYIFAHEAYHIRRKDTVVKAAAFLLASVYWFHPLVWLSYFLMIRDMEMSCDEHVLKELGNEIKQDYSRCLLAFAVQGRPKLTGPLAFGESQAGFRIKNILHYKKPALWTGIAAVILIGGLAGMCLTDREDKNMLRIKKVSAENPGEFATSCEYSLQPYIKSAFIYADLYEEEVFAKRIFIGALKLEETGGEGEGILTVIPSVQPEHQVTDLGMAYTEGPASQFVNVKMEKMFLGFSISRDHGSYAEYRMQADEPRLIAAVYLGDEESGRVESYLPDYLEKAGSGTEEFEELLSKNAGSLLIYVVISEESV